jgi:hypothetical protein
MSKNKEERKLTQLFPADFTTLFFSTDTVRDYSLPFCAMTQPIRPLHRNYSI